MCMAHTGTIIEFCGLRSEDCGVEGRAAVTYKNTNKINGLMLFTGVALRQFA